MVVGSLTTSSGSLISSTTTAAAANGTSAAPYDFQTAVLAFFQDKKNVSLCIVVPLIGFLYAAACISYAISRCRRKKVRAARRRRALSSGEIDARDFVNAQAVRHGSESSLKSLIGKDRNRIAPDLSSVERQNANTYGKSDKARGGQTLDFVASNNTHNAREYTSAAGGLTLNVATSQREQAEGKRAVAANRFADPSILSAIREEPSSSSKGDSMMAAAAAAGARSYRRTSYPVHAGQDRMLAASRLNATAALAKTGSGASPAASQATAPLPSAETRETDRHGKSIPLQEHVEEALQSLRVNSSVDAPSGKDLRQAMKTVISLEMEVKNDPKAQEMIARYRESKQKNRQTNINDSLKKGEWQKVPISEWIALKRSASEVDSTPSSVTASTLSRY